MLIGQAATPAGSSAVVLTQAQLGAALEAVPLRQGSAATEIAKQPTYAVRETRRVVPGGAEVHEHVADVWYVLRGKAVLVTGGTLVDAGPAEAGEIRGKSISGGERRELSGGEVVVIPAGVPHWISEVQGEFVSLVVKASTSPAPTK